MEFQHNQDAHYEGETYEDSLTAPNSTLQLSTLRQEHEGPRSSIRDNVSRRQAMSPSTILEDLFGPNAGNVDEYYQDMGTQQPFRQEAPTLPVSNDISNQNMGTHQPFWQDASALPVSDSNIYNRSIESRQPFWQEARALPDSNKIINQSIETRQPFCQEATASHVSNDISNQNIRTHQPFWHEAPALPVSNNVNNNNIGTHQPFWQESKALTASNNINKQDVGTHQPFGHGAPALPVPNDINDDVDTHQSHRQNASDLSVFKNTSNKTMERHQQSTQEPSNLPVSEDMNNANDFDGLFSGADYGHMLEPETDQMATSSQLPDAGQATYPVLDNQLATSRPDYQNAHFAGLSELGDEADHNVTLGPEIDRMALFSQYPDPGQATPPIENQLATSGSDHEDADFASVSDLNGNNGFGNVRDEAYMRSQIYRRPVYSQGPHEPVPKDLILKSNHMPEDLNTTSASSFLSTRSTAPNTTRAESSHPTLQWPGMDLLLSDPDGLLSQNTNAGLDQARANSSNGGSVLYNSSQWQGPAFTEHSMRDPAPAEIPGHRRRLPQNQPRQQRGSKDVDVSNASQLSLERSLTQPNQLPYSSYQVRASQQGPLETSHSQPADRFVDQFIQDSALSSHISYPDAIFNRVSQRSRQLNEPYSQHKNTPYIYDGAIPLNTETTPHRVSMDHGSTSTLDLQMRAKPNSRKRVASFDEDKEDDIEETFSDLEDDYEFFFGSAGEDGSTQTSQ